MARSRLYLSTLAMLLLSLFRPVSGAPTSEVIPLAGPWRYELDREDGGVRDRWFARTLTGTLTLPGSLPGHGIGDPVSVTTRWTGDIMDSSWFTAPAYERYRKPGNVRIPFWLQPETYYAGVAWYQRDIVIPDAWKGRRIALTLERPHWATTVWIGARRVGADSSLSTPHVYDLGRTLAPGKHVLTIRVDNGPVVDVGRNSHSVSDNTQGNWNGIVGSITLTAASHAWISDLQAHPRLADRSVTVRGAVHSAGKRPASVTIRVAPPPAAGATAQVVSVQAPVRWTGDAGAFTAMIPLGATALLWDEFDAHLYTVTAEPGKGTAGQSIRFGMREVTKNGRQLMINGRPLFVRGTLECAIFPRTGHPPADLASWRRIIGVAKDHGLNLLRFHSWCPPESAFVAADEAGFYYQVEAASWPNQSTSLGDGKPVDRWMQQETERILRAYGNHPSFIIFSACNEPGGDHAAAWLARWVANGKSTDPRRLYTSGSGWPQIPENDLHVTHTPRIHGWGAGLTSRINARPPETRTDYGTIIGNADVPLISHEIGQWCVYPNFDEIPKYTGYLKPRNFEIFRDQLAASGMAHQAKDFLFNSGKLQVLCYKEDIESALRTPSMGGFQLLDLHDFPGQGTALVGMLDPFWESKGYVTPAEFRRFCNSTVVLARMDRRVFTTADRFTATVEVAHYGRAAMPGAVAYWRIIDTAGVVAASGRFPGRDIPLGNGTVLGDVDLDLRALPAPRRYIFETGLEGTEYENGWDIWVYPSVPAAPGTGKVTVVEELNDAAIALLNNGGRVLWTIPGNRVHGDMNGRVKIGFSSIFWNTAWTARQAPHTLGILCDPSHPALADFPTESHSNWQWWYLIRSSGAMILDGLPRTVRPIVQVIDDWFTNRRLGLLFEASVGRGRLLVCSMDLKGDEGGNPVARQMMQSLIRYMEGEHFRPEVMLTPEEVRSLSREPQGMERFGARVLRVDSEEKGFEGERVLDDDPATFWHTPWIGRAPAFPHEIVIEFRSPGSYRGITLLPRQDGNRTGSIRQFRVYTGDDGLHWGEPVAEGTLDPGTGLSTILFPGPVQGRYLRFVAESGHAEGPWASLAEMGIVE